MCKFLSLGLLLSISASAQTPAPKTPVPHFQDVAKQVGLTVSHISTPEKKYIVESMSGGAGLVDCGKDGKLHKNRKAHVLTPVTATFPMAASSFKKKKK